MALIDLEKAFDKIDQTQLVGALKRFKIPDAMTNVMASLYENPQFRSNQEFDKSASRGQASGIRQGCPLSPYLCIIVMTSTPMYIKQKTFDTLSGGK